MPPPKCPQPAPSFNLNLITTAISLYYSPTDPHTSQIDMDTLQSKLSQANLVTKEIYGYNHMDFVWGKNAAAEVYDPLTARTEELTGNIQ